MSTLDKSLFQVIKQQVENPETPAPSEKRQESSAKLLSEAYCVIGATKGLKDRINRAVKYLAIFIEETLLTSTRIVANLEEAIKKDAMGENQEGIEMYAREKLDTVRELGLRVDKCRSLLDGISWKYKAQGTVIHADLLLQREV